MAVHEERPERDDDQRSVAHQCVFELGGKILVAHERTEVDVGLRELAGADRIVELGLPVVGDRLAVRGERVVHRCRLGRQPAERVVERCGHVGVHRSDGCGQCGQCARVGLERCRPRRRVPVRLACDRELGRMSWHDRGERASGCPHTEGRHERHLIDQDPIGVEVVEHRHDVAADLHRVPEQLAAALARLERERLDEAAARRVDERLQRPGVVSVVRGSGGEPVVAACGQVEPAPLEPVALDEGAHRRAGRHHHALARSLQRGRDDRERLVVREEVRGEDDGGHRAVTPLPRRPRRRPLPGRRRTRRSCSAARSSPGPARPGR